MKKIFFSLSNMEFLSTAIQLRHYLESKNIDFDLDMYNFNTPLFEGDVAELGQISELYNYKNVIQIIKNYKEGNCLIKGLSFPEKNEFRKNLVDYYTKIDDYDIHCFSVYLFNIDDCLLSALAIKRKNKNAKIIFGGVEITLNPCLSTIFEDLDICYSYGDVGPSVEYALESQEYNCTKFFDFKDYKAETPPIITDYELEYSHNFLYFSSGTGCNRNCKYCNCNALGPLRVIDLDVIKAWFIYYNKIGVTGFNLTDPNLTKNEKWFDGFLDIMIEIENKIDFYPCMLEISQITDNQILKLRRAGFRALGIGVDGISEEMHKIFGRKYVPEKELMRKLELLNRQNIEIRLMYMFGPPGQTYEIFMKEYKILKNISDTFENVVIDIFDYYSSKGSYMNAHQDLYGTVCENYGDYVADKLPEYIDVFKQIEFNHTHPDSCYKPLYKKLLLNLHAVATVARKTYVNNEFLTVSERRDKIDFGNYQIKD